MFRHVVDDGDAPHRAASDLLYRHPAYRQLYGRDDQGLGAGPVIAVTDLMRAGQLLAATTYNHFEIYTFVAGIYLALCYPLTLFPLAG